MKRTSPFSGFLAALLVASFGVQVQLAGQVAADRQARPYVPPKTPDGQPDLQGVWSNNSATPLERPKILAGRQFLTDEEVEALKRRAGELFAGDGDAAFGDSIFEAVLSDVQKYKPTTFDIQTGNYNAFWLVERDFDNRTSLITDPPDGRIPPLTADGQKRAAALAAGFKESGTTDPEVRGLSERCITFGVPDLLAGYNSYFEIVQSRGYVVFLSEKIHDARIIPLDGRPHMPAGLNQWTGDARGRWEGNTLVVETRNLRSSFRGASNNLQLTERFTRIGPNTINYEVTFNDPATWTRPWTLMVPLKHTSDLVYEYACHEGNSGLEYILKGARAEEAGRTGEQSPR
jgi:hypothetical protein